MISMLKDITMTAKEKSNIPRTVVTMAPVPCTSILTLVMGLQKYNMTPCHGGDRGFKSRRGRQTLLPLVKTAFSPFPFAVTLYDSIEKSILKSQTLKYYTPQFLTPRQLLTTPHQSISATPTPSKSVDTFRPVVSVELVVISLMSSPGRLHHEDGTRTPGIPCQPDCG